MRTEESRQTSRTRAVRRRRPGAGSRRRPPTSNETVFVLLAEFEAPGPNRAIGYLKQAALVLELEGCGNYAEAAQTAAVFINPMLDSTAVGNWNPQHATWAEAAAGEAIGGGLSGTCGSARSAKRPPAATRTTAGRGIWPWRRRQSRRYRRECRGNGSAGTASGATGGIGDTGSAASVGGGEAARETLPTFVLVGMAPTAPQRGRRYSLRRRQVPPVRPRPVAGTGKRRTVDRPSTT